MWVYNRLIEIDPASIKANTAREIGVETKNLQALKVKAILVFYNLL